MNGQAIVQWLTPLVMLTLAGAFVISWRFDPGRRAIVLFPASYIVTGFAFSTEILFREASGYQSAQVIGDWCYILGCLLFTAGLYKRRQRPVPWVLLGAVSAGFAFGNLSLWGAGDVWLRTVATTSGTSILLLMGVAPLRPARRVVDKILLALVPMLAVALVIIATFAAPENAATFDESPFIAILNLVVTIFTLAIALSLLFDAFVGRTRTLEREALTDPLTSVLNRRGFETTARRATERCVARGEDVAFIILDIDHFKSINDRFGHPVGDIVLSRFARLLLDSLGPSKLVGRIGGEEFAIIVPDCDAAIAALAAEDLRTRVAAMDLSDLKPGLKVTATFGVSEVTKGFDAAFIAADAQLLAGKRAGRDRVMAVDQTRELVAS